MLEAYRRLDVHQRLGAVGALIVIASMFLPWYGLPLGGGIAKTGFTALGWAELALLMTVGAALVLLYEHARGRVLPFPLDEGTLMLVSGLWSGLLVVYLMFDRPTFRLGSFDQTYNLRYGIFIALSGASLLFVAGLRERGAAHPGHRRAARLKTKKTPQG